MTGAPPNIGEVLGLWQHADPILSLLKEIPAEYRKIAGVVYDVLETLHIWAPAAEQWRMMQYVTYLAEHLTSLRQEIAHLQSMNTHYANKTEHSPLDESALEIRTVRLLQIKKELANLLVRPNDPKVWWEKLNKPRIA